jgi:hypothetical protein
MEGRMCVLEFVVWVEELSRASAFENEKLANFFVP